MTRRTLWAPILPFLAMTALVAQPQANRPELNRLPRETQLLVLEFLDGTCGAGVPQETERRLIAVGPQVELAFWEAYRLGPLRTPEEDYRRRFGDRQKWLRQVGVQQMGQADAEKALAVTEQQYVSSEVQRYREG
ncbi:MAG: hypothetical protein FJW31_26215 [Acidobacteria bacterium]|nr:hypothetical protein [Acidobacteriota bacterium]